MATSKDKSGAAGSTKQPSSNSDTEMDMETIDTEELVMFENIENFYSNKWVFKNIFSTIDTNLMWKKWSTMYLSAVK